jgi:hypothetical protein
MLIMLPVLFLIVSLGTLKPETWTLFGVGCAVSVAVAAALTVLVPRLYPWGPPGLPASRFPA